MTIAMSERSDSLRNASTIPVLGSEERKQSPMPATKATGTVDGPGDAAALVDEIAERIRQRIMSGEFPIGTQLRQAALATEFKVSRTPVREALRQLQAGGLITVAPNRGAVVRVPAPWEVREAYEVRAELEGLAAERAATRISADDLARVTAANETMRKATEHKRPPKVTPTALPATTVANDTFHMLILGAARNERLTQVIQQINESFPRNVMWQVLAEDPGLRVTNVAEHAAIIAGLEAGDGAQARAAMRRHVLTAGEHLARWYEQRSTTVFRG
jgi:DNA-binding GntR family transcriptional regulator